MADAAQNEIIFFENQGVKLEVNLQDETVWLTQAQIAELYGTSRENITMHIKNIFKSEELEEASVCKKNLHTATDGKKYRTTFYNLDMIISLGYRVNSVIATTFRRWATNILKDYAIKGYAVNQTRLQYLEKTVKLLNIANRATERMEGGEAQEVIKIISGYYDALDLLNAYDTRAIKKPKGSKSETVLTYNDCFAVIDGLKYKTSSNIFGVERSGGGLDAILGAVYQSFAGKDVYPSVEEKIANLLYLVVKNHPFVDGNKRIGATLFIYALSRYGLLYRDGKEIIDSKMLAATTLLIAESSPLEKELMIDLVVNFLAR